MSQPELGKKISELRNKKGITQKELSESCNIDIRTIQRIESGDVFPRTSTIKLIAEALEVDLHELNGDSLRGFENKESDSDILFASMIIGIIFFINWFFYAPLIPRYKIYSSYNWIHSIINVITNVFFYYGFYMIAKHYKNKLLKYASSFFMVSGPVYFIITIVNGVMSINQFILSVLGINSIFLGFGLLKTKTALLAHYKSAGILQLLIAPFFILPIGTLNIIGCWMNIPLYVLMLYIMFLEYRKLKQAY